MSSIDAVLSRLTCLYRSRLEWTQRPITVLSQHTINKTCTWRLATNMKAMLIFKNEGECDSDPISQTDLHTIQNYGTTQPVYWLNTTLSDLWTFLGNYRRVRCDICCHESWVMENGRIFPCDDCNSQRFIDMCTRQVSIRGVLFDADQLVRYLPGELADMFGDQCRYGVTESNILIVEDPKGLHWRAVIMGMSKDGEDLKFPRADYVPGIGQFGSGWDYDPNWFAVADWLEEQGYTDEARRFYYWI